MLLWTAVATRDLSRDYTGRNGHPSCHTGFLAMRLAVMPASCKPVIGYRPLGITLNS